VRILCVLGLHRWDYVGNWSSVYRTCVRCGRDEQWRDEGLGNAWVHLAPLTKEERAEREREPEKPWSLRNSLF